MIKHLNIFKHYFSYLIFSILLLTPSYLFAQNADSTSTSFRGGGAIVGSLIAWWICSSRRHKPIGGWLLYYVYNVIVGLLFWIFISIAAFENYCLSSWPDTTYYLLYLLTTIPDDLLTIAEFILVCGLTIERFRSWTVIKRLRLVLTLSIGFSFLSIFIDMKYFKSETVALEVFGLIWPVIWFLYFMKSDRVKSIYRDNNFIEKYGMPYLEEKITGKTVNSEKTEDIKVTMEETKRCEDCGIEYNIDAFPENSSTCIVCQSTENENININNKTENNERSASADKSISHRKRRKLIPSFVNNFDSIALSIGGLLIALRLFFPPKYYSYKGMTFPYNGTKNLAATSDFQTALLQSLGVAVITGVIFFIIRKRNKKK